MLRETLGALRETDGELCENDGARENDGAWVTLGELERKLGVLRETGGEELTLGRDMLGDDGWKLGEPEGRIVCELGEEARGCAAT